MYSISAESWGVLLTFSENFTLEEAQKYDVEIAKVRPRYAGKKWGVIVDSRNLKIMMPGAPEILKKSQEEGKKSGMVRSCVVLSSPIPVMQAKRMARESGIYDVERFLDGNANPNWKQKAMDWVVKGIDPD
jgi:hypothetical protein